MTRNFASIAIAALLCSAPAFAGWHEEISQFDAGRYEKLAESRDKGLDEAENGATAADLAAIHSILDARAVAASPRALTGTWHCRTMKLGGVTPAIVYSWFACRISEKNGVMFLEKLGGSTRTAGTLYPEAGGFVYLGAQTVKGEKQHAYSGNGVQAGGEAAPDDQVGILSLLADGRARLELPYPVGGESTFDVLELKR
jgi:hypothetical protein